MYDKWQTRNSYGSGYDYSLTLQRSLGGTEEKYWIFDWSMRDRYGGKGSLQLYKAWQWNGSAYQFKEYSTDTWHCCTADLPWPALERIQYGYQGYPYWRSKQSYLDLATGGS